MGATVPFKPLSERYEVDDKGCWMWSGATDKDGYGLFSVNRKHFRAHRYFFEFWNSTRIPPGMVIDHLCNRKRCVNPAHMRITTNRENILRSPHSPSAINARRTECKNGHPLSGDNLRIRPNGRRRCLACERLRMRVYSDRNYREYYARYNAILNEGRND